MSCNKPLNLPRSSAVAISGAIHRNNATQNADGDTSNGAAHRKHGQVDSAALESATNS